MTRRRKIKGDILQTINENAKNQIIFVKSHIFQSLID